MDGTKNYMSGTLLSDAGENAADCLFSGRGLSIAPADPILMGAQTGTRWEKSRHDRQDAASEAHSPRWSRRSRTARSTKKRSATSWTGRFPRARTAWSRSAPPARARRCRMTSTRRWSNGASIRSMGRVPVIAGAGSNSTAEAIELSQHAEEAGADAVLIVTPYYNKPTQEGLYQHYKAINDAIGIPIIIYNIPGRSIVDMSVDTMKRLFELKNIAGVKDATANMTRVSQQRAAMGEDFNQTVGRGHHRARLHGAWRPRLHLGDVERRAAAVRRIPDRLPQGRLQGRAQAAGQARAAAHQSVRRNESRRRSSTRCR